MNMKQFVEKFKEHMEIKKYSKTTIYSYIQSLKGFLRFVEEKEIKDIREITSEKIKEYQMVISEKNISVSSVHAKLRGIKRFFEYLEENCLILINPADKIVYPSLGERLPQNIPSEEEMIKVLSLPQGDTFTGLRDKTLLELLYSTGIRLAECSNLTIYDVDCTEGYLRVNHGKGAKDRVLPIGKRACDCLKHYMEGIRQDYLNKNPHEKALFIDARGKALSRQMIGITVRNYGKQAQITNPVTVHAIRRAFATHLLKNGAHPMYIQKLLGHSTGETLRRYVKVTGKEVKDTHEKTHPRG
ncbi:MAG: tyrosine-type recombinase/integrase [Candidatus Aureabacteria bacterium]|nr:tyrosine-type recombinase/integrase [Candidatus Auribacterota bacterium]